MINIVFSPYKITDPPHEQVSNIAFMMLHTAIMNTEERGDDPKSATMWVAMNDLFNQLATLEQIHTEQIITESGLQNVKIVVLKEEGGVLSLSEMAFNLVKKIWDAHKLTLSLKHARHVVAVENILAAAQNV